MAFRVSSTAAAANHVSWRETRSRPHALPPCGYFDWSLEDGRLGINLDVESTPLRTFTEFVRRAVWRFST